MNNTSKPPRLPPRFLKWFSKEPLQASILGDLEEQFDEDVEKYGKIKAKWKFTWNVIRFCRPGVVKNIEGSRKPNQYGMFKNYFKIGFRNLLKYKTFSFINVFGLSVSMAIGLLVIQMLYNQSSFDDFHKNKERVFRVLSKQEKSALANARSPVPMANAIVQDYPIVEDYVQLFKGVGGDAVSIEEDKNTTLCGYFSDDKFFQIFDFELFKGNKTNALADPNSMIITKEKAYALFGEQSPIGKTVLFSDRDLDPMDLGLGFESAAAPKDWGVFKITGVIDLKQYKTHVKFDVLVSSSTLPRLRQEKLQPDNTKNWKQYNGCYTYLLLNETSSGDDLQMAIDQIVKKEYAAFENLSELTIPIQKLSEITPGRFLGAPMSIRLPIQSYYFLGFLALIILFSACLNYTNLSIARSLTRAKEIGIRKVSGATRKSIVVQFLVEAVLTSFFALLMANVFFYFLKDAMRGLWMSRMIAFDLDSSMSVYLVFIAFSIIVGLLAGLYPALMLSKFSPIQALKKMSSDNQRKIGFKQVLSGIQFVFALIFIVSAMVISQQFQHYRDFEYGLDTNNVVNIPMQGNDYQVLSNEFKSLSDIVEVSACELLPSLPNIRATGVRLSKDDEWISTVYHSVDRNFFGNLGIELIHGEPFKKTTQAKDEIVVDETMTKRLGFERPIDALGQRAQVGGQKEALKIIGVVRNLEFKTPVNDDNGPVIFWSRPENFNFLNVRVAGNNFPEIIERLEEKWKGIDPVHPFQSYIYNDQLIMANLWMSDFASIIGFISLLAIVISCLGLLGMAVYTTERRTKEVGIRKVMGASIADLTYLLSWSFIKILS